MLIVHSTDLKATFVRQVGRRGNGNDCMQFPIGVTVSPNKDIVVCDNGNSKVNVFHWEGKLKFCLWAAVSNGGRFPSISC